MIKIKIKETYLLMLIIISLVSLGVYSTYALFTASTTIEDAVGISTTLDIGKSLTEYEIVSVSPGDSKIIELNITNSSSNTIYYGAWYKVAEGNQEDINIGLYTSDEENSNSSSGTLSSSSSIKLLVGIANNGTSDITIYLGVKGSTTNELNLSSDKHLITGVFASEYTVNLTVVNGTSNVSSVNVNKGSNAVFYITANDTYGLYIDSDTCNGTLNSSNGIYTITNVTENKSCTLTLRKPNASDTLTLLGLTPSEGTPDFSKTSCTSGCGEATVGLYKSEDDIGDTYYFRGDVENNYVYFAGFYWRIIRINGDGSIRMIYDGTIAHENGISDEDRMMDTTAYNISYNDNAYVGYMYGSTGASRYEETHANTTSSTIKTNLDSWYKTNIVDTGYSSYVVDAIYCNDRSLSSGTGIGTTQTYYKAYNRLVTNKTPTLECSGANDKFTVSSDLGNEALEYPIGLITADEVAMAGGKCGTNNSSYYLYMGSRYLTMTPFSFDGSYAYSFYVSSSGNMYNYAVSNPYNGYRGVISIKGSSINAGTGTREDSFKIITEANSPDLVDGLIPVTYNTSTSSWVKADSTNSNNSWYDYDNKMWANAVLVSETNRSTYQSASAGTTITESDILAFYVWIPRYKYKVWNIDKVVGTQSYNANTEGIDIVFENGTSSTGTISCEYSYDSPSEDAESPNETCTGINGDYYTHPAFTFDSDELRGFWIGKYELSSSSPNLVDGGSSSTNLTPRILPNVTSWRGNSLSNFNTVIQNMQIESNIYGLNTSRTNTDSHMLTNMEWGAVAYLANSKYGRCTNGSCTEVTINNCASYKTGIGGDSKQADGTTTTCTTAANKYNGEKGVLASTTGNVYGVYDMSGGSFEYVMGNVSSEAGVYNFKIASSGFDSAWYTTSTAKYITTYAYGTSSNDQTAYNRGRLGDATGEVVKSAGSTGGWYSDHANFSYSINAWFHRGGHYSYGYNAGVFSFNDNSGSNSNYNSSRAALVSVRPAQTIT